MAFGFVPRFSPSFSHRELFAAANVLLRRPDEEAEVHRFEEAFARSIGARHGVMVPSARFGFYLLLQAFGLEPGDEVIIPALTYFAIPGMAATAGFTPVLADIGRTTYVLDPESFRAAITERTRAVVPTHLFGTPCDMDAIRAIAAEHDVKIIEDCAQSTGATWKGQRVGSLGDAAYYTFGLTKNMTTLKGAMITTDDPDVAARVREQMSRATPLALGDLLKEVAVGTAMRAATHPLVYPWSLYPVLRVGNHLGEDPIHDRFAEPETVADEVSERYWSAGPRALQARVGLTQLDRLDKLNGARRTNGYFLAERLAHVPGLTLPSWPKGADPIFMSFVVQHPNREDFARALRRRRIDTTIGYMTDASTSPIFEPWHRSCPNATHAFDNLLHLPVHPAMTAHDRRHMAEAVRLAALEVST